MSGRTRTLMRSGRFRSTGSRPFAGEPPAQPACAAARRSAWCWRSPARRARCCSTSPRSTRSPDTPIPRSPGGAGRQPDQGARRRHVADRQRPLAASCDGATATGSLAQIDFLGEGDEERLTGKLYKFPPRRHALSDAGLRGVPGVDRRPASRSTPPTTARTSRSAPSIRPRTSAPRCTSMRCSASISRCWDRPAPASRPRRADPPPHLRAGAAGPYRDDRPARRIWRGVPRATARSTTSAICRCRIG